MSASVYYKFRAQREPSRITFDGTGISVWELKREIILQNKMGKGLDFDLAVYSQDTEEEYKDDNYTIPRSSQVIVRRLPPARPGKGSAAQYVADLQASGPNANVVERTPVAGPSSSVDRRGPSGPMYRGQMSMRFDGRDAGPAQGEQEQATQAAMPEVQSIEGDEASKIAAMFQASSAQWDETQERMSQATYRERPGMPSRPRPPSVRPPPQFANAPAHDRPPPIGYICFRCGTKGHWIHDCPTNNDREFDNKPRFKRTTGIPKSMLKTVEAPADGQRDGVMVTPDGSYVVAQVDSASWARNQAYRQKRLTKSDVFASVPSDGKLACSLCGKLLRDAVRTPCCSSLFCQECITNHLLEHEFQCPECEKLVKDLTELRRDDDVRKEVREYVDAEMDSSERKMQEAEQAEKEALEKAEREREEEKGVQDKQEKSEEEVKSDGQEESKVAHEDEQGKPAWNPQAVQQVMMMLCNPQLPPPMRMQLQMQLKTLQAQFLQMQQSQDGSANQTTGNAQQQHQQQLAQMQQFQQQQRQQQQRQQQQQQGGMLGAHNAMNPFANGSGINMFTHPLMSMASMMQPQQQHGAIQQPFRPAAPLSHHESAYMRLPVNSLKRAAISSDGQAPAKRGRPADFLELGAGGNFGPQRKEA